ncbi:MAG: hypothetical protein ORN54_06000 [Cyclobacteriaceae bacterium]|nr:hypothetical protein [Cyclobacteriaceae bacterium]
MANIKFVLKFVLFGLIFQSFNININFYQIECISIENDGYITLKIWDSKQGKNYKADQARKDAIHAILFSGVPPTNSCATQKPILTDSESQNNFEKIQSEFFGKNGAWTKYTRMAETQYALPQSIGKKNWKVYQVAVAKNLLRKDLEDQKIIKSLNSGF